MQLSQIGEFGLIDRLVKLIGHPSSRVVLGVGDDAAAIKLKIQNSKFKNKESLLLITTDTLVENVHFKLPKKNGRNREFILRRDPFFLLGRKAMAANISDIAAMGGVPTFAVVTIGAPSGFSVERIVDLYRGLKVEAKKHKVSIVGGDTVRSPQGLIISITLLGEVEKEYLLTRSGARVGDLICVTGKFGGPASKKYDSRTWKVESRTREARIIAKARIVTSMIDSSDGLVRSVIELCKGSKVGAKIYEDQVPIAKGATLDQALYGGEEYELMFTLPRAKINKLKDIRFTVVGEIVGQKNGVRLIDSKGRVNSLIKTGYDHFCP